jgi:hypothetical protein
VRGPPRRPQRHEQGVGVAVISKPKKSAQRSYDEAAATRLWQVSTDLVGPMHS